MFGGEEEGVALRQRTVAWGDPAAARRQAEGLTGLAIMRAIRDGTLPAPPMARLVGFDCVEAEPGRIVMALQPDESLENPAGLLHGGVAVAMLDTAMGAAVHTLISADRAPVTLDLHATYLKPLTVASGVLRATGVVASLASRTAYATGELRTADGQLVVHAVANFSIAGGARRAAHVKARSTAS